MEGLNSEQSLIGLVNTIFTTLCKHSFHIKCIYPMFDEAVKKNTTQPKIKIE